MCSNSVAIDQRQFHLVRNNFYSLFHDYELQNVDSRLIFEEGNCFLPIRLSTYPFGRLHGILLDEVMGEQAVSRCTTLLATDTLVADGLGGEQTRRKMALATQYDLPHCRLCL